MFWVFLDFTSFSSRPLSIYNHFSSTCLTSSFRDFLHIFHRTTRVFQRRRHYSFPHQSEIQLTTFVVNECWFFSYFSPILSWFSLMQQHNNNKYKKMWKFNTLNFNGERRSSGVITIKIVIVKKLFLYVTSRRCSRAERRGTVLLWRVKIAVERKKKSFFFSIRRFDFYHQKISIINTTIRHIDVSAAEWKFRSQAAIWVFLLVFTT